MGISTLRVGITGGIGAGKSLVCKIFSVLGAPVYDADMRAKQLMNEDPTLVRQISERFGSECYRSGQLDRNYLSQLVFKNPDLLHHLNQLVHPRVAEDTKQWVARHSWAPYVIKEAALLIESGASKELDKLVVVTAPLSLRVLRVRERDSFRSKEQVEQIISRQLPEEEKIKQADYLIHNDESTLVIPQVLKLHKRFITLFRQ